jgi:hypothetical protein
MKTRQAPKHKAIKNEFLSWQWKQKNPTFWFIESSVDGKIEWEAETSVGGEDRQKSETPGFYYRIKGFDSEWRALTNWSNVVFLEHGLETV